MTTVDVTNNRDGWISDRTNGDEGTLYVWGDHGSEFACSKQRFAVTDNGERRIRIYCDARAHGFPDVFAAHAAGIVLGLPPQAEKFPGQHALNWLVEQANKVDFTFVNTQLGIIGGQNVTDAVKRDWANAVQSGEIASALKDGKYEEAWASMKMNFKASAEEAARQQAAQSPPGPIALVSLPSTGAPKHVSASALRALSAKPLPPPKAVSPKALALLGIPKATAQKVVAPKKRRSWPMVIGGGIGGIIGGVFGGPVGFAVGMGLGGTVGDSIGNRGAKQ